MDTLRSRWASTVLKSIGDAVIATDTDALVVFMNRVAEELTGWTEEEARGQPALEVLTLIDQRTGKREAWPIQDVLQTGKPSNIPETTVLVSRSGRQMVISDTASPILEGNGNVAGAVIVFRDVTRQREASQALQRSEERFRSLFESMAEGYCVVEVLFDDRNSPLDYRFLEVNPAFEGQTGIKNAQGKLMRDLFPNHEQHWFDMYGHIALTGETMRFENEAAALGRWYEVCAFRVGSAELRQVGIVFSDITSRKRTQEELNRRASELQSIFDAAPVGINVAEDPECRVIRGNGALSEILGTQPGENISKSGPEAGKVTYTVFSNGRELEPHELPMQRAATEGIELSDHQIEIRRANGTQVSALMNAKPIRDGNGKITGAVGICVDVTELKKAEDRLRDADKRKDEFLAMLAHELRNPLAAIGNAVSVLKMSADSDNINFAKDVVERQTRQLARLVDDLLDVQRITSDKIRLRRDLCDAKNILTQAIESVEPLMKERKHHLITEFEDEALTLRADVTRLEQVFINLLTNAAKYTDNGGTVRLEAKREGDDVVISVRDNGMGIAPEKLPQMFELFAQGERSLARSEGGLGIGLTIVQKLTEMHGGTVIAESKGHGQGSVFSVRLPAASQLATAMPDAASPTEIASRKSRILVVDDNEDTARSLVCLLKLLGNDATVAYDGPTAIEAARITKPEYVLLDIGLPVMDGYEVVARLRQEPCCRAAVIIAISGYGQEEDRRRSSEAGFDHHLVKPVEFDKLISLLSEPV